MPDQPSKEQFDAAAQKVLKTAPPGLSRDQFFALIDKELAPSPEFSKIGEDSAPKASERLGEMLQPLAHPQTVSDFGNILMAPVDATRSVLPMVAGKVAQAASNLPSLRGAAEATARAGGAVLESPLVNIAVSPKAAYLGRMLTDWADALGHPSPARAVQMVDAIQQTGGALNDWESKFLDSVKMSASAGREVSPAQADVLKRMAKTATATPANPPMVASGKPSFTAAETLRGLALLRAGIPEEDVFKILLSQRPKP